MPREIQGPSNTPQPPKTPGLGPGGVRAGYDQKNGGGQQQGKKPPEPEPEPIEEEADEEGHLDADSFARKRYGGQTKDFLTDARMPWEVEAEERRRKLAELRKNPGGTGPLSAARQQKAPPKGLPARLSLSNTPGPAAPKQPPAANTAGRQVEGAWDASAAVNATFNAYQQIKEKQEERDRQSQQPAAAQGASLEETPLNSLLTKGTGLNRDAIAAARADEAEAPAAGGPSWLAAPADDAPAAPPSTRPILPKAADAPRSRLSTPAAHTPRAPKLQTGSLSTPSAKSPTESLREPVAPRREPLSREPARPIAPEETPVEFPVVDETPVAAPVLEPELEAEAEELPSLEELAEEEPILQGIIPRLQAANDNPRLGCRYLIMDGDTNKPLGGARLEFEPTQDDRLPVVNGQADFEGMFEGQGIPPGLYQVTVRSPGYIPQMQTHYIKAGEVDEGVFHLKKP